MRVRHVLIAVGLAAAPVVLAVSPANALLPGQTICYGADGSPVVNPADPDEFEHCVTRPTGSGSGGNLPVLCNGTINYATGEYTYTNCTPVQPYQG